VGEDPVAKDKVAYNEQEEKIEKSKKNSSSEELITRICV